MFPFIYISIYIYMYICIYVYRYVDLTIHMYKYKYTYIYIYIHIYVYLYISKYICFFLFLLLGGIYYITNCTNITNSSRMPAAQQKNNWEALNPASRTGAPRFFYGGRVLVFWLSFCPVLNEHRIWLKKGFILLYIYIYIDFLHIYICIYIYIYIYIRSKTLENSYLHN